MITYKKGNIFDSDADCIFNTVNCEGFMGKGIAYQFKLRFPENNRKYVEYCRAGKLRPGNVLPFIENGKTIINFPTKDKWRAPSKMQYITEGLDAFVRLLPNYNIKKAAIPPLGCGNGGLAWKDVKPVIEQKLRDCDINIELFEPSAGNYKSSSIEQMSVYDLLLLYVRKNLKKANSLRFQKTFYLLNYYGAGDIFAFSRGRYGPYSKELYQEAEKIGRYQKKSSLNDTEETYESIYRIICSKKVDSKINKLLGPTNRALEVVNSTEDELLLEGTATALYLIKDELIVEQSGIINAFKEWSDDKADRFDENAILRSLDNLEYWGIAQKNLFNQYEVRSV